MVAGSDLGPGGDFFGGSDEEEGDDSSDGEEDMERQLAQVPPKEREEFLVQSAMARIERARARGRDDVNLNKFELAALDRRRKRMERGGSKKKRKDQRVAVPLTQLEPVSRKNSGFSMSGSRHASSSSGMGDDFLPQGAADPFQFQTSGSRSSRRQPSNPADLAYSSSRRSTRSSQNTYGDSGSSDEDSEGGRHHTSDGECSSDKSGRDASRGRPSAAIVESADAKAAKKTASKATSPSKRKSTRTTTASTTTRRKK